jgi:anti-sigma regulatory factor (Ser/Thr protein kinase)
MPGSEQLLLAERYPAEAASVGLARRAVTAAARDAGIGEAAAWNVMLAVSEAVTNAVLHGFVGRDHPGHVDVRASVSDGEIVVTVDDDGVGLRPRTDSPGLGLGLPTIAALADTMDVRQVEGAGTHLSFSLPLAPVPAAG